MISFLVYVFALMGFSIVILSIIIFIDAKKVFLKKVKLENPKKIWFWKNAYIDQMGIVKKIKYTSQEDFCSVLLEPKTIKRIFKKYPLFIKIDGFEYQRKETTYNGNNSLKYEIL